MTAIAAHQVTPVECTPWCGDGTGHADAEEADEQGCYSTERRVDLLRIPVSGQGPAHTSHVTVHLYRDAYPDGAGGAFLEDAHIEVSASTTDPLRLSPSEAFELSAVIAELADAAQSR